jgi:transposase InsO family protein
VQEEKKALQTELLLQQVQRIRTRQKRIGARKLLFMMNSFFQQHKIHIGRDAFFDLLREHGLLIRKRRFKKPRTTFSGFWMKKYPNLAKDFIPTAPNQLWVSDITYIAVGDDFAYLSLITDAYSHKVVGFYLSKDLSAEGPIMALKMALKNNPEIKNLPLRQAGLIHHSDRGLQYYSEAYIKLLGNIRISMSENSDPLENPIAERMNGILKEELLDNYFETSMIRLTQTRMKIHHASSIRPIKNKLFTDETFEEAQREVAIAISIYNHERPHGSVDNLTPAMAHLQSGELKKRWKNYYKPKSKQVMESVS